MFFGSARLGARVNAKDSPHICLVLHSKAAGRDDVRAAVGAIRDQGFPIDVHVTWESGDATRFAREAADAGCPVVIAGGGDGTVNEVVCGLADTAQAMSALPSLAVLPLGTANDLARSCNVPLDPFVALHLAVTAPAIEVDVGKVNQRWFLNVATGGFGTQVTVATPNQLKAILGSAAYLVTGLKHFTSIRPAHARVSGPDFEWDGAFLVLAVGNGRQAGGGHQLCSDAMINDGLLDVRLLPRSPNEEIADVLDALLREGMNGVRRTIISARVPWLNIESDEVIQINLDGEPIADTHFRFESVTGRLRMKLPPDCPLLG
jgi:lipid kinase YegS